MKRIIGGYDPKLRADLITSGVNPATFDAIAQQVSITPFAEHMPLRDAIDFVYFLIYATVKLHRYKGGAALVGGPIEIAAITADRGFRWILHKPLSESIVTTKTHFA